MLSFREKLVMTALGIAMGLLAVAALFLLPGRGGAASKPTTVVINQVMTNNPDICRPVDEEYYDWLELLNTGGGSVNLAGWMLSNQLDLRGAYVFGDVTLPAGGTLTVYCADAPGDYAGDAIFTGFRMNSNGLSLILSAPGERAMQVMEVPPMRPACVYQREAGTGEYAVTEFFDSQAGERMLEEDLTPDFRADSVYISELMPSNKTTLLDGDGDFSDWMELYNGTGAAVRLADWSLSDDDMERRKWVFPDVTLGAGEYLVLFASGKDRAEPGSELHTSFGLSAKGETVRLYTPEGKVSSWVEYGAVKGDISVYRTAKGALKAGTRVTPGFPNTAKGATQAIEAMYTPLTKNSQKLYINEVYCAGKGYDWVELVNNGKKMVDLSGYGLSDNQHRPRKWQFPEGAKLKAGGCLVVYLTGETGSSGLVDNLYCANFGLSKDEMVVLSTPEGKRVDGVRLMDYRRNISYGRASGQAKYRYFSQPTPGKKNGSKSYARQAHEVEFSVAGGVYKRSSLTLKLSAEPGMAIYYTTDGTEPTSKSARYTKPFVLKKNALIKAVAWQPDALKSPTETHSYVLGGSHTVRVLNIFGPEAKLVGGSGILNTGKKAGGDGVKVYVEMYEPDGSKIISQFCDLQVRGHGSRVEHAQKGFSLTARRAYGDTRFRAKLFKKLPYTKYKSLFIRASGQDSAQTHMRDSILTSLAADTTVLYQETELCAVYIAGKYWGEYNMRERISPKMIAQHEGWDNPDDIILLEGSGARLGGVQGKKTSFEKIMKQVRKMDFTKNASVDKLAKVVDIENYLDYVAIQIYTANQDLNNVRCYCNPKKGGRWRWILADLDLSYQVDADSPSRWLKSGGVGTITTQDNTLFIQLMKNARTRKYFLTRMGKLLATTFSAENVASKIKARYNKLKAEMPRNCKRWGWSTKTWKRYCEAMFKYSKTRPKKLIGYFKKAFRLSDKQMKKYFGEAAAKISG